MKINISAYHVQSESKAYNIVVEHQFYRLLSAVFYDPGFELGLGQSEEGLHEVFVLQKLHSGQVNAGRCRDKVHPEKDKVYKKDIRPTAQYSAECEIMPNEVVNLTSCL